MLRVIELLFTAHRFASAVLTTAIPPVGLSVRQSVCPSGTRRYCVKTTSRSPVQFALSDLNKILQRGRYLTCANFGDNRLRGLGVAGGQNLPFSIDFDRRPYNTLALPCECVIRPYGRMVDMYACMLVCLFLCFLFVCTVTDFSAAEKDSGVKRSMFLRVLSRISFVHFGVKGQRSKVMVTRDKKSLSAANTRPGSYK